MTYHDTSSCQFVELSAMKRFLRGAPIVSGPANVESYREVVANGTLLTTSHDGYLRAVRRGASPGADGRA